MKVNRLVLLLAAGASAVALTGCAPTGDVALKVGSTTYSDNDVNLLTKFRCAIAEDPSTGQAVVARATARSEMATVLVASAIDQHINEDAKVPVATLDLSDKMKQLEPFIDKAASGADRDRLRDLVETSLRGGYAVGAVVQQALGQQLSQMSSQQSGQVIADGVNQLRANAATGMKIKTDPVFGLSSNGLETATADPSASRALSPFAKAAISTQPDQAWVDGLRSADRCG